MPVDYNCHFWQLRESIQGIEPPAPRSEDDFDPTAKYHVAADVEYMRWVLPSNGILAISILLKRLLC